MRTMIGNRQGEPARRAARRRWISIAGLIGVILAVLAGLVTGCSSSSATTTSSVAGDTGSTATTSVDGPIRGGILKHALAAATNLDPALLATAQDSEVANQWSDYFVYLDENNQPDPERSLAETWKSNDEGTVWDFTVRKGVKFHDGKELTSADIVFTFKRLSDANVAAATAGTYANIQSVEAPDASSVRFTLKTSNPDFLLDLGDYHALVMDSATADFKTIHNGTGPFMIESYSPEDRIVFTRNPNYWMQGEDGQSLPYLDGMEWIFLAEASAQVDALRGGQVDFLNYLTPEYVQPLKDDAEISVKTKTGNYHYVIHMRSDQKPASDAKVRQALKLATDRQAILDTVALGLGSVGKDTPIGPSFGGLYLDAPDPVRDVAKAKALLTEAGYPDGLQIELTVQQNVAAPAIATVWKEQLAEAGVTVDIVTVPVETYYGADNLWLNAPFAITDWGSRPYPQPYLDQAYVSSAQWNESHFADAELDSLAKSAATEMDPAKRAELYQQIQQIFIDRGPVIVPYFQDGIIAFRNTVKPTLEPAVSPAQLDLRKVWLDK